MQASAKSRPKNFAERSMLASSVQEQWTSLLLHWMKMLLLMSHSGVKSGDDERHLAHDDDGGRIRSRAAHACDSRWTTSDCASGCDRRDSPALQTGSQGGEARSRPRRQRGSLPPIIPAGTHSRSLARSSSLSLVFVALLIIFFAHGLIAPLHLARRKIVTRDR